MRIHPRARPLLAWALRLGAATGVACAHPHPTIPAQAACPDGGYAIAGVCLSRAQAAAYCGKGARPEAGGCVPRACDREEPVDLGSGECVPVLALRRAEAVADGGSEADAGIGCGGDAGLSVEGTSLACLPREALCGRGARWTAGACHADPVCPAGAIADASGVCRFVVSGERDRRLVDVGAWIRLVLGADGGEGTATLCGPFRERPWRAGVAAHGVSVLDVEVSVVFPDNMVSAAHVDVTARRRFDPHNLESSLPMPVANELDPLWDALRALGGEAGEASAASATVGVRCTIEGGTDVGRRPKPAKDPPVHSDSGKPAS